MSRIGASVCVPVDDPKSDHLKTLILLSITESHGAKLYFVTEGSARLEPIDEVNKNDSYHYNEHICGTDAITGFVGIFSGDSNDVHGLFDHEETKWMTEDYINAGNKDEYLRQMFPQLAYGKSDDGA